MERPPGLAPVTLPEHTLEKGQPADGKWLLENASLPVAVVFDRALTHNITWMQRFADDHGAQLAPHGKTTMTPALFARQLAAGAWGITAATPWQVRVYRAHGIARVLLANELVDLDFVAWLRAELDRDPSFEFVCYVDSVTGVERLAAAMGERVGRRPLGVVLEVGLPGGRTGCRSNADIGAVAQAVAANPSLALLGVAGYEGPLGHSRDPATRQEVEAFVRRLADTLASLDVAGLLDQRAGEYYLTCGGSGHVDVVTAVLENPPACARPVRSLLRSGSYLSHDDDLYARTSSLARELRPAIEVWCQVLSRPEPGLALLGAGRRDLSFDAGLPVVRLRRAAATGEVGELEGTISKLNDQHAFLEIEASRELGVGDLVCLGISHPCTTHDKWQLVPLLDDERCVVGCLRAYF